MVTASAIFGYKVTLSLEEFREIYKSKLINDAVLERIICDRKGAGNVQEWKEKVLNGVYDFTLKPRIGELRANWKKEYFIDEQRFGPYAFWHHKHFFKTIAGGIEMNDLVHYALPMGVLGQLANAVLVKSQLKSIFEYRFKKMEELFGKIK